MDLERTVGLRPDGTVWLPDRRAAVGSILLKLAAMGVEIPAEAAGDEDVFHLAGNLFARYREQARLLADHLCPADRRIQHYLDELLAAAGVPPGPPPRRDPHPRPVRPRPRAEPPARRRHLRERAGLQLPPRQRRAAQPGQRPPHHPGRLPRRRGRAADPGGQDPGAARGLPPAARGSAPPAGRAAAAAVHGQLAAAGRDHGVLLLRPLVCPAVPR